MLRGEPLQHVRPERRRRGDGDPRHASPREDEPGAQLGHCLAPRVRIRAIDDHLAVEMVELVLHDAGRHSLELEMNGLPLGVEAVQRHLDSALDGHPDRPERETALLVDLGLVAANGEHRIDDDAILTLVVEDEEPSQDADLRRGKPHALGVVHEAGHPLGQPRKLLVEGLDLVGAHPQDRVAVLADLRERDAAPRLQLGTIVVIVLVVVAVVMIVITVVVIMAVLVVVVVIAHAAGV